MRRDRFSWLDDLTIWLLLVGGIILPILGWFVGVILLWSRGAWSYRDRLVGTLLLPGGLCAGVGLLFYGTHSTGLCASVIRAGSAAPGQTTCSPGTGLVLGPVGGLIIIAGLIVVPLGTAIYLARSLRQQRSSARRLAD